MKVDIFVRNISAGANEDDLREAFAAYGRVTGVTLVTNRETGRRMGFGFVTMPDEDEAISAIHALRGTMVKGQALEFQDSRSRFERRHGPRERHLVPETGPATQAPRIKA